MYHLCILVNIYICSGCANLTAPLFGTMDCTQGWGTGANVYFTCDPHTVINGPSVRTCQNNNQWSGNKDPTCGQYITQSGLNISESLILTNDDTDLVETNILGVILIRYNRIFVFRLRYNNTGHDVV